MGEIQGTLFSLEFNRSVRVRPTEPEKLTPNAGALVLREVGERLGLWGLLEEALEDPRDGERITHPFGELLRTAVLTEAQGWSSQRDVEVFRNDPAFRIAVSERKSDRALRPAREGEREPEGLASQPTLSRLMATLSSATNREGLTDVLCAAAAHRVGLSQVARRRELALDLDSLPMEVHGSQPGSAFNGHYGVRCFHPLIVSWEFGDFLGAKLREGNVHTATDALDYVVPYLEWAGQYAEQVWLRVDAGFPSDPFLGGLEERDDRYVVRIKTNSRLEKMAWPHVDRIADTPDPQDRIHTVELEYAARKWSRARRVVLVIDEAPTELFPRYFFLVTNASQEEVSGLELLERYRRRGQAEKDYGEWQNALNVSLSSTNRPKRSYRGQLPAQRSEPVDSFAVNEATMLLSLVSANLLHAARSLMPDARGRLLSRTNFQKRVLQAAACVARTSRYVTFWVVETYTTRWQRIVGALDALPTARGSPQLQALPSPA